MTAPGLTDGKNPDEDWDSDVGFVASNYKRDIQTKIIKAPNKSLKILYMYLCTNRCGLIFSSMVSIYKQFVLSCLFR